MMKGNDMTRVVKKAFSDGYYAGCKSERERIVEALRAAAIESPMIVRMLIENLVKVLEDSANDERQ